MYTLVLRKLAATRGDSMLEMILIMSAFGTAVVGTIIIVMEWRALVGYWRLKRQTRAPVNFPVDEA